MKAKWIVVLAGTLLCGEPLSAQGADRRVLGAVDFFGSKGIDVAAIRSVLPFREDSTGYALANDAKATSIRPRQRPALSRSLERTGVGAFQACFSTWRCWPSSGLPGCPITNRP